MNELALFAGAGGGILASQLLGWRTVCAVERDAYAATILAQRQNDGLLEAFPIWSDVTTFDGKPWRGIVDVISGGFPCQDISVAGKGAGIDGERSGLWKEFARIIGEVRPQFTFIENSPALVNRGLDRVLSDLAALGYDAEWMCLSAAECGAPHLRDRIWILAYANSHGLQRIKPYKYQAKIKGRVWVNIKGVVSDVHAGRLHDIPSSYVLGKGNGMAGRVDRTKALGNGQVPRVAATAFIELIERLHHQQSEQLPSDQASP